MSKVRTNTMFVVLLESGESSIVNGGSGTDRPPHSRSRPCGDPHHCFRNAYEIRGQPLLILAVGTTSANPLLVNATPSLCFYCFYKTSATHRPNTGNTFAITCASAGAVIARVNESQFCQGVNKLFTTQVG